ncbi:MAG: hypothetical protein QM669_15815 [Siphonobacter sp.]
MVVLGIILIVIGAIAFMVGWTILQKRRSWLKTTGLTAGLVEDGKVIYEVNGQRYGLKVTSTNLNGRRIPVRYSLATPGQARPYSPAATWVAPAFFMLLGSGLMFTGIGLIQG